MPNFAKEFYTYKYKVTSFDCDKERRLRQSAQMRIQQEAGELHLYNAGYPYVRLYDEFGFYFVITRMKSKIYRAPLFGEVVKIKTWSMGVKGAQYIRNFQFTDDLNRLLIESSGSYVAVDVKSGKLLRPNTFMDMDVVYHYKEDVACGVPGKVALPETLELLGSRRVQYSDVDYNGHLNNTVYLDFIADYIPGGLNGCRIKGFQVNYLNEALEGDVISISGIRQDDELIMTGILEDGRRCFSASAILDL